MGAALAAAVVEAGHQAVVVSGPVATTYPPQAEVVPVVSTEEMLDACLRIFPSCDGLIAAAAPCDYRPVEVVAHKIRKTGGKLLLELVETPDVVAALAAGKTSDQWIVAFALETEDQHLRAMQKLERKNCDLIVLNGPTAIDAAQTSVEALDREGRIAGQFTGDKSDVSRKLFDLISRRLAR